jgi:DNA mismatch repair protein MutL
MSRIRQLDSSVINKIAAGEVIERPASVIKELVENSLDAKATRIDIDVERGGADLIRVVDNGSGIHPEDLELAISSHATSKLKSAADLFHVLTMGFRGEALASIAEVSHLSIRSRQEDAELGTEIIVHAGSREPIKRCGAPLGTRIEIKELFFNTPVRRKFMKTAATEFSHLTEQFTRLALANPQVHFTLTHNDKPLYDLPPVSDLRDRLTVFFGKEILNSLIPVTGEQPGAKLTGFVGHPELSKTTRKQQYLYLNRRWIQDRSLQHALTEAYRGLLMVGRQPVAFLFLEIPPDEVDVNVHPTKNEVRFVDSQPLYRLLLGTVRRQFLSMNLESQLQVKPQAGNSPAMADQYGFPAAPTPIQRELIDWAVNALSPAHQRQSLPTINRENLHSSSLTPHSAFQLTTPLELDDHEQQHSLAADIDQTSFSAQPARYEPVLRADWPQLSSLVPVSVSALQIDNCYLVVPGDTGLTIIDQHALHERILYEQFKQRVLTQQVESQRLLVPETIELSVRECQMLLEQQAVLQELGFGIAEFGSQTLIVDKYPVILGKLSVTDLLKELCEQLDTKAQLKREELLEKLLQMMSCKAAVKAGQRLTPQEIDALVQLKHLVDHAHHCPHGRPTTLNLSRHDLDRQFGRLG